MYCPNCRSIISDDSNFCSVCGEQITTKDNGNEKDDNMSDDLRNMVKPDNPNSSPKSRAIAAVLAWVFGWCGVHLFYVGRTTGGILSAIFFWTGIPAIVGFIHFIIILCGSFKDKDGKTLSKW